MATLIHTFNPTLINEFTFGVNRYRAAHLSCPTKPRWTRVNRAKLGIDFPQFFPQFNPLNVIPNATFGGVQNAPSIAWEQRWIFFGTNTPYTLSDNISKIYGKHNLKAGIYLRTDIPQRGGLLPRILLHGHGELRPGHEQSSGYELCVLECDAGNADQLSRIR